MKTQSKLAAFLLITVIGLFSQGMMSIDNGNLFAAGHGKNQKENKGKKHIEKHDKDQKKGKVLICHTPPGNPANKQEIWVSPDAVQNHLAHGDLLGSCSDAPPPPPPGNPCEESCIADCAACIGGSLDPELIEFCNQQLIVCKAGCHSDSDTDGDGIPDSAEAPECINDPGC